MPATFPDPEDFDPFPNTTWEYSIYSLPQPDWLKNTKKPFWDHRGGMTRKIPWGLTIDINAGPEHVRKTCPQEVSFPEGLPCLSLGENEFPQKVDGKGFISIIGGNPGDPGHDGTMRAEWEGDGKLTISISLNQRRLAAKSMGLSSNPEALALDVIGWQPSMDPPGRLERELMEFKKAAEAFLAQKCLHALREGRPMENHARTQDDIRKKLRLLQDDVYVGKSRDLREENLEKYFVFAVAACFAANVRKKILRPPTRDEIQCEVLKDLQALPGEMNPGSWSYIFNHLGFGWL